MSWSEYEIFGATNHGSEDRTEVRDQEPFAASGDWSLWIDLGGEG